MGHKLWMHSRFRHNTFPAVFVPLPKKVYYEDPYHPYYNVTEEVLRTDQLNVQSVLQPLREKQYIKHQTSEENQKQHIHPGIYSLFLRSRYGLLFYCPTKLFHDLTLQVFRWRSQCFRTALGIQAESAFDSYCSKLMNIHSKSELRCWMWCWGDAGTVN